MPDNGATKDTLEKVLEALKSSESMLNAMVANKTAIAEKLTTLDVKLENVEKETEFLTQIVHGFDGGLQVSAKLMENRLGALEEKINERYSEWMTVKIEGAKGKWILAAAAISGLAGLITSVVSVLLK